MNHFFLTVSCNECNRQSSIGLKCDKCNNINSLCHYLWKYSSFPYPGTNTDYGGFDDDRLLYDLYQLTTNFPKDEFKFFCIHDNYKKLNIYKVKNNELIFKEIVFLI